MKYTAINIGPVVPTISLGRRPRELWTASYMFCYLMECIIEQLNKDDILSPATLTGSEIKEVGLYPDRVFVQGDINPKEVINNAVAKFREGTEDKDGKINLALGIDLDYLNIMHVSIERDNDTNVIKDLNQLLDCLELYNRPATNESTTKVLNLIRRTNNNLLFRHTHDEKKPSPMYLGAIATAKIIGREDCKKACKLLIPEKEDELTSTDEDKFYQEIKNVLGKDFYSYYKYIAIVQADGDNMGKIISNLETENVKKLSRKLLEYGSEASKLIQAYGGMPIYAGGDDLLFLAPVVSANNEYPNIFNLLDAISETYTSIVDKTIPRPILLKEDDKEEQPLHTSVSFGLSISYYKYPLYEAFAAARNLLFQTAKNVEGKNAIAWCLRKHSGSGFTGSLTMQSDAYKQFKALTSEKVDETTISAIAHKLRSNEDILNILQTKEGNPLENRIKAFFLKTMEEPKPQDGNTYIGKVRTLLCTSLNERSEKDKKDINNMSNLLSTLYCMLRSAKFINGEGDNDE